MLDVEIFFIFNLGRVVLEFFYLLLIKVECIYLEILVCFNVFNLVFSGIGICVIVEMVCKD